MGQRIAALAAGLALSAAGCGSSDRPVAVTPEMEQEQRAAQEKADAEEKAEAKARAAKRKPKP